MSEQNIYTLKDSLYTFQVLQRVSDTNRLKDLQKRYLTNNLLNDSVYWQKLKNVSLSDAFTQLSLIQNLLFIETNLVLEYYSDLIGGKSISCNFGLRIAFAPKKLDLIEGETFEADIYTIEHLDNILDEPTFIVNNQVLKAQNETVHFIDPNLTIGEKIIKTEVRLKNRFTGEFISHFNEFKYRVRPKCAKNCQ